MGGSRAILGWALFQSWSPVFFFTLFVLLKLNKPTSWLSTCKIFLFSSQTSKSSFLVCKQGVCFLLFVENSWGCLTQLLPCCDRKLNLLGNILEFVLLHCCCLWWGWALWTGGRIIYFIFFNTLRAFLPSMWVPDPLRGRCVTALPVLLNCHYFPLYWLLYDIILSYF